MEMTKQVRAFIRENEFHLWNSIYTNKYKNCRTIKFSLNDVDFGAEIAIAMIRKAFPKLTVSRTVSVNRYAINQTSIIVRIPFSIQAE